MYDIFHEWGGDISVASGGDIALSTGSDTVNQRVFRRLLTNPGDYIWNVSYGGGLGQFVGAPANPAAIEAVVTAQLLLEAAIPTSPAPQIDTNIADTANGYVVASITYSDPVSGTPIVLNVTPG